MIRAKLYFSDSKSDVVAAAKRAALVELAANGIDAATITASTGVWNGATEPGFVLEVLDDTRRPTTVRFTELSRKLKIVARTIAYLFGQESVLVTVERVEASFTLVTPGDIGRARDTKTHELFKHDED